MKKRNSTVKAVLLTVTICSGIFTAAGISLLPAALYSAPLPTQEQEHKIPYSSPCENCGILLLNENQSGILIFLDFDDGSAKISMLSSDAVTDALKVGYEINYTLYTDLNFVCRLCDRLGGIVINKNGSDMRYLSTGLRAELEENDSPEMRKEVATAFFEKISKIGLSSGDFKFIIENTRTNLNYPACYEWMNYIPDMFGNFVFLD